MADLRHTIQGAILREGTCRGKAEKQLCQGHEEGASTSQSGTVCKALRRWGKSSRSISVKVRAGSVRMQSLED